MKDHLPVWECVCGHIEHSGKSPEDCPKCLRVGEYDLVPEDMIEEKLAESVLLSKPTDEEDD